MAHPRIDVERFILDVRAMQRPGFRGDDSAVGAGELFEIERDIIVGGNVRAEIAQDRKLRRSSRALTSGSVYGGNRSDPSEVMRTPSRLRIGPVAALKSTAGTASVAASCGSGPAIAATNSAASSDRSRERTDRVECRCKRHGAVEAHESVRRLEPGQPAERRRNANRAAGIRSDRSRRETRGHRDGRSARRTSGDTMVSEVPGIPRRAHRLVAAPASERKFDHVRLAERNHSRRDETRHRRRRVVGDAAAPARGTLRSSGGRRRAAGP